MEMKGQLHSPGATAPGTHFIGGWVGPRVGLDVMKKGFLALPGIEPRPLGSPARSLVAIPTELSRLRNRNIPVPKDVRRRHDYDEAIAKNRNM
jgi:hypothetical protein